jgi:preprotein translocase subunit SecD
VEGIYWLRVSAVLGLVLGCLWVLAPTFLGDSAEDRNAVAVSGVDRPGATAGASLDVRLPVEEGEPGALAAVLKARLDAAGVSTGKVEAGTATVDVKLSPGANRDDVARLSAVAGRAALYAPTSLVSVPAELLPAGPAAGRLAEVVALAPPAEVSFWQDALPKLDGSAVPASAAPLPATLGAFSRAGDAVRATVVPPPAGVAGQPFGEGVPFALVAVDGAARGVIAPDGRFWTLTADEGVIPVLIGGALPGRLAPPTAPAPAASVPKAGAKTDEEEVTGIARLLPDKRIVLGLDLVGGIDLTLQVDLEEAVMGQVARDLVYLKDQAVEEGLAVATVRRDFSAPILQITTTSALADVQSFMSKRANEYEYLDSEAGPDGTVHRFQLRDTRQEEIRDQAVEQVLETLRKRVNATGVKEPSIARKGGGRIEVQLPGLEDVQAAVDAIGTTAVLEFHMVDAEFDAAQLARILADAEAALPPDQWADDRLVNQWAWTTKKLKDERTILWQYAADPETGEDVRVQAYAVMTEVPLTGNDVNNAGVGWDQNNDPYVTLEFKPRGSQVFCDLTGKAVGKQFAIVLDGRVQSAPGIREQICGGQARIEMKSDDEPLKASQTLALVLRTGALDAPVVVASVRQIGASLGKDAIYQGTLAAILGGLLVCGFMLLWYQTSGMVANVALLVNVLMLLATLAQFGATLTLPGIAGIALTVGMAVDSNIIVYERIREELRLGVQARKAVDVGFEKALVAIVDANITTAIAGIVMYSYGTGPLKGFAVTLLVGIVTTLVTAVFVTRTIMEVMTRSSSSRLRI